MNEIENVRIARRYFDALRNGDLNCVDGLLDDQVVWHQPGDGKLSGTYRGKARLVPLLTTFMGLAASTFQLQSVKSLIGDDNLVAARLNFSAPQVTSSRQDPTDGVDLMRIELGKITEVWHFSEHQLAEEAS
jgi:uncharacterized protein